MGRCQTTNDMTCRRKNSQHSLIFGYFFEIKSEDRDILHRQDVQKRLRPSYTLSCNNTVTEDRTRRDDSFSIFA